MAESAEIISSLSCQVDVTGLGSVLDERRRRPPCGGKADPLRLPGPGRILHATSLSLSRVSPADTTYCLLSTPTPWRDCVGVVFCNSAPGQEQDAGQTERAAYTSTSVLRTRVNVHFCTLL